MKKRKKMFRLDTLLRTQSFGMQRKLFLYWISMFLMFLAALLLVLSLTGIIFNQKQKLSENLDMQLDLIEKEVSEQMNTLTARGILLSQSISHELEQILAAENLSAENLNNRPEILEKIQNSVYEEINTAMRISTCSGAYMILNATTNTRAENAENSRSGLYLRFSDLNANAPGQEKSVYFRGIADIAREKQIELHNRWNLEFDISLIPGFSQQMGKAVNRLADSSYWMRSIELTDTWENVMLLNVPILDKNQKICGSCGLEISSLYFNMCYSGLETSFGTAVLVTAPSRYDQLLISQGLVSGLDSGVLKKTEARITKKDTYYNTYTVGNEHYVGKQQMLSVRGADGEALFAAVLLPEESYKSYTVEMQKKCAVVILVFLVLMTGMSLYFSRRFTDPIIQNLSAIQSGERLEGRQAGISEIDMLLKYIQEKNACHMKEESGLPPNIEELFRDFEERVFTLTTSEKNIMRYYAEGYDAAAISEMAYISMSTVRKHSGNIYRKLGVASKDEMMLYLELFRRCDRLQELFP